MAHHVEPMDIDSDFDNKENSLHHNNVLPFTEKGYEELDVSELNMKLRYSVTPVSSPMSKSYTACLDNRSLESGEDSLNITVNENSNLTRSLNSTMTKNDSVVKSLKALPLQAIPTEQFVDSSRNSSVFRTLDSTVTPENGNVTVTVSAPSDTDENLSLPSSSSSALHTPEATTPTKDIPAKDGGSPIMRGLKSVFSMFRTSQSPIPPVDNENAVKPEILSPLEEQVSTHDNKMQTVLASTPIAAHRKKEMSPTKRSSPQKEHSIVFNDDLEKELQWKDETTIIFSQERIPIHKLMLQQPFENKNLNKDITEVSVQDNQDLNSTVEYMDISYNDSLRDRTVTEIRTDDNKHSDCTFAGESDSEFVDCETTFTKNDSNVIDDKDKTPVPDISQELNLTKEIESKNDSGNRLKPVILDTTQDILDATLSVRPEDLLPEILDETKSRSAIVCNSTEITDILKVPHKQLQIDDPIFNQSENITGLLTLETNAENPNTTKTVDGLPITHPIDQTFDVGSSNTTNAEFQDKDFDVTKTKDITLNDTDIEDQATITLDNKTFDAHTLAVENHKVDEFKTSVQVNDKINEDMAPVTIPISLEETINKLLHSDPNVETVKEASMTELPVDIPLPDEDDLDKELNMPTEIKTELIAPSVTLPLDLVDDIKISPEITDILNTMAAEGKEEMNKFEEKAAVDIVGANPLPEGGDNANSQTLETNAIAIMNKLSDTLEQTNIINEILEPVGILDRVTSSNTILKNESTVDSKTENIELRESKIEANVTENKMSEKIEEQKHETFNEGEVPMDINDSNCELKLLPDVVNVSHPENIESTASVHQPMSDVTLKAVNIDGIISDMVITEIGPETIKLAKPQITTQPFIEANKVIEEIPSIKPFTPDANESVVENQPSEVTTTSMSKHDISINKNVTNPDAKESDAIVENTVTFIEKVNIDKEIKEEVNESTNTKAVEEEIVLSENNSPFVSVIADNIPPENTDIGTVTDSFAKTTKIVLTPPGSPPIRSKGYNFNFDDMDFDPFATKTNIRMSPPLDSPNKLNETTAQVTCAEKRMPKKDNRRKSQPERKRPAAPKRKLNSTFGGTINDKAVEKTIEKSESSPINVIQLDSPVTVALNPSNVTIKEKTLNETIEIQPKTVDEHNEMLNSTSEALMEDKIDQPIEISAKASESSSPTKLKEATSSSEQSVYYSAGASSSDGSLPSRNVFNLPEIDDINFNPFATKSKMCQSPDLDMDNPFVTKSKVKSSPDSSVIIPRNYEDKTTSIEDKLENDLMEKEVSANLSSTTSSSKATGDKNTTTSEIHTEDEDTVEGPFLEAEELNTDDKMSDIDGENIDMMQFNELPTQTSEENLDNGELFIDAEAFEFLLNQNKCNTVVDSGKESLFLKFDPLFAKRMSAVTSDGVVASLARLQRKQSTPTKATQASPKNMPSPIAGPFNVNITQDMDMNNSEELNDELNITVSKPMMVVPPAVNPVTPRNKSLTPNRSNRRSFTFTSPAMAVIDRLLSLSGNNSMVHDTTVTQISREQNEADIALTQLRELLAEKEISVYNLRSESHELRDRLSTLESHVKNLESVNEEKLKKINELNDTLAEKTKINRSMAAVVEEYERTIASLIAETAQDKKRHAEERIKLINERDEQTAHLTSMEVSFSDLHSKYEKSKQVILNCKANEDAYKKSIKDFEENFTKMQNNYELLKQHATSKLNHANQEMEKINRAHEAEVLKLNAMIKRKELHITSLEESLNQKTKANEELTAICDELINKVG